MAEVVLNKATGIYECPTHGAKGVHGCANCWEALKILCKKNNVALIGETGTLYAPDGAVIVPPKDDVHG